MTDDNFGAKLALVLKTLTISNGRLAADLAVDKSLVGRWVSGAVTPSAHNLGRLTRHLAQRVEGFSLIEWEMPLAQLRARMNPARTADTLPTRDIGDVPHARTPARRARSRSSAKAAPIPGCTPISARPSATPARSWWS